MDDWVTLKSSSSMRLSRSTHFTHDSPQVRSEFCPRVDRHVFCVSAMGNSVAETRPNCLQREHRVTVTFFSRMSANCQPWTSSLSLPSSVLAFSLVWMPVANILPTSLLCVPSDSGATLATPLGPTWQYVPPVVPPLCSSPLSSLMSVLVPVSFRHLGAVWTWMTKGSFKFILEFCDRASILVAVTIPDMIT